MNKKITTLTFGCVLIGSPLFAQSSDDSKTAIDLTPQPAANEWQHSVSPYLWLPAIEGQMGVNGIVSDVDVSQSDILYRFTIRYIDTDIIVRS